MKKYIKIATYFIALLSIFFMFSCKPNVHTISFELNGGTPELENVEVLVGETISKPANPTKEGYSFGGWFIDENFTQQYDFNTKVNNSYTLYAKWTANKYSIFFNSNGGTDVSTLEFEYNSLLKAPDNPTKTGYVFEGWYLDEELSQKFDWSGKMPAKDLTLYANWEANKYEVIYTSLGVELPDLKQLVSYNTKTTAPKDPVRTGYTFNCWLLNGQEFDFDTVINKSITLSASWSINSYTISYNTLGGSEIESSKVEYNAELVVPMAPTKTGYTFAGWMFGDELFSFDNALMPANDIELTAVWTQKDYVISYNKNSEIATGVTDSVEVKYDEEVVLSECGYSLAGYTFVGWNTKADGTGTMYSVGTKVKNLTTSGVFELYAIWEVNTYEVSFNSNGGSGEMLPQKFEYGAQANLNVNTFNKEGYTFIGWATTQNGLPVYDDKDSFIIGSANVILYAIWKANDYKVIFDSNGGSGTMSPLNATYDKAVNLSENTYTNTGYKFLGWATSSEGEVVYEDCELVNNLQTKGEITLYAKWEKILYTFTIILNNGQDPIVKQYSYNDSIEEVAEPTMDGRKFENWIIDGTVTIFTFEDAKMPASDLTIYAKWENENTITFNTNGGSTINNITGYAGDAYEIPENPTKTGYTFAGWFLDDELQNEYTLNGVIPEIDIHLYAAWDINSYTVKFEVNGGTEISDMTLNYDSTIEAVTTKTGYTFVGWYKNIELTQASNLKVPANDTVLYAKWEANTYVVSYNKNNEQATGRTLDQTPTYDVDFNIADNGYSLVGYTFDSWNTKADGSGVSYNAGKQVSNLLPEGEIELFAIWTPNTYEIKFNANGGTGTMPNQSFTYNAKQNISENKFTRAGYTFLGWAKSATALAAEYVDGYELLNLTAENNAEIVLYAVWEINTYTVTFKATGFDDVVYNDVEHGTSLAELIFPVVNKIGHSYRWMLNGSEIEQGTLVTSNFNIIANYTANTYTVSFVINNKVVYSVEREYGEELSFSEYITILKNNMDLLVSIETEVASIMSNGSPNNLAAIYYDTVKSEMLQKYYPNTYTELEIAFDTNFSNAMALYSIVNTEKMAAQSIYYSYEQNNGNPSMDGYIFGGWLLGEETLYEQYGTGDEFKGYVPASKVLTETAYIVASFVGVDPIDDIAVDQADDTLIKWKGVDGDSLGFNQSIYDINVEYQIYNVINSNEMALIATSNKNSYQFMQKDTYSIPGRYNLVIKAVVTISLKSTGDVETVLVSELPQQAFDYLLSMSENNLEVDKSGDYYYRGTDSQSELTTFYFYTNMTYDFTNTDFVFVNASGEAVDASEYPAVSFAKGQNGTNSIINTSKTPTAFYFKTSPDAEKVFYAKVLPLVSSFYFGEELSKFNATKNGNGLFLDSNNSIYQIGAASSNYTVANGYADYENNGFEFRLDVRTSGGEKILYKAYEDFIQYKFYKWDGSQYVLCDSEKTEQEIGHYNTSNFAWEFIPTSGRYKVEISIKDIYVAPKLIEDGIIKSLTFEFELNNRVNVYSHEVLKRVYGNVGVDFRNGINLHSDIIAQVTELQRYTEAAASAGNPFVGTIRDGSTVNKGIHDVIYYSSETVNKFSGNVYARISSTELNENYVISGNLFNIDGSKLPYSSVNSKGNLSNVTGYKIVNQQCAIFLYNVTQFSASTDIESNSTLNLNDLSLVGNTTVPSLNSSSEAELQSSLDIMNRNSGGYLGTFLGFGADLVVDNSVINNTTIAVKLGNGDCDVKLDYFYSEANWSNAIFNQGRGDFEINNSHFKNSGGAALHLEDQYSTATESIGAVVKIDQNTIIDNYVSGEEGYFKAYSLEFAVMQMKSSMESGIKEGTGGAYTMLKTVKDPISGLETQKVNFIMLSIPQNANKEATGSQIGQYGFNIFNISANETGGAAQTFNYNTVLANANGNALIFNKYILNGGNAIPTEGVLMSCNNIPGMGNAFIVAGVYLKG